MPTPSQAIANLAALKSAGKIVPATPRPALDLPAIPQNEPQPANHFRGPLADSDWTAPDAQRQWYSPNIPQSRITPPPVAQSAQNGAAIASVAAPLIAAAVAAAPTSGTGTITSINATVPSFLTVSGVPITSGAGTIALASANASAGTYLGGPSATLGSLEALNQNYITTGGGGSGALSLTATPSSATSWGLYVATGTTNPATPSGWTAQVGGSTFTNSFTGTSAVSISQAVGANATEVGVLALFNGAFPTIVQSASAGWTFNPSQTLAFGSGNTAGNTLLIVVNAINPVLGPYSITASDSQGNQYTTLSNLSANGSVWGASILVLIAPNCAGGANTVTFNITGPQSGGTAGEAAIFELGPLGVAVSALFIHPILSSDVPPINLGSVGNGGVNGILKPRNGGTGQSTLAANGVVIGQGTGGVTGTATGTAGQFLTSNGTGVDPSFQSLVVSSTALTGQTGSIGATNILAATNTGTLYQINYYFNVTSAGTGGTATLTFTWNDGAAQTFTTAAITLGTLGSYVSGTLIIKPTTGAPQYSTTVTTPLGSPQYSLDIRPVPLG
jgi:hypothetical protein